MIFKRSIQRELANTAGAVFTILFTIAVTIKPIKILGMAANGKVDSNDVFILIGFAALNLIPVLIVLTGFISVLIVISRNYHDSEMVVWLSSGASLRDWMSAVLRFAAPFFLLTLVMTFFVSPWATLHSAEFTDRFEQRSDISRISPGKFQESASRDRIFFVEGVTGDLSKVKNIFVNTVDKNRQSVVVAQEGEIVFDKLGDKFVILHRGRRYDGTPSDANFQMMQFDRYGVLIEENAKDVVANGKSQSISTIGLWTDPTPSNMGELLWRISLPVMSVVLMLLAIPLGYVNPRSGRSANFLLALFLCILYYNMVLVSQTWVAQSQFSFIFALWPIHLFFSLLVFLMFCWRMNVNNRYHPLQLWSKVVKIIARPNSGKKVVR